jgi:hypothetical protein
MSTGWRGGLLGLVLLGCLGQGCHALYPFDVPDSPDQSVTPDAALDATADGSLLQDAHQELALLQDAPKDQAPKEAQPPDAGKPKGAPCAGQSECAKGLYCVDGVCCDAACGAKCVACNVLGKVGSCVPVPGADLKLCYKKCAGANLSTGFCDGAGSCGIGALKQCPSFLVCDPQLDACPTGCTTHADCVKTDPTSGANLSTGVCDRTKAHKTGLGVCVNPAKVAEAGTPSFLTVADAVNKANEVATKFTHVLLRANTTNTIYQVKVTSVQQVTIVGDGRPILQSLTNTDNSAGLVVNGGTLLVQDVTLTHMSGLKGHGATCQTGTLGIFESTIRDNSNHGVVIAKTCDFELRRSVVQNNKGGGLSLQGGGAYNSTLVNNVIVKNGSASSMSPSNSAGLKLIWHGTPLPVLYNNVIADNLISGNSPAGIDCNVVNLIPGTQYDLHNTIVWGNSPSSISGGCKFHTSDVQTLSSLTSGNISSNPQFATAVYDLKSGSLAVDKGGVVPASITTIDYNSKKRLQGAKTDMGAHER